ncbi:MAG: thiamine phosphate synthase [Candidatus Tectomicrobia bacterium]|nr:thiamine phosphate synthase [Candidatus Tectomicrobia bacterium]
MPEQSAAAESAPSRPPWAPRLYLVTDRWQARGPLPQVVAAALAGGVDAVQLREKDLGARQLAELAAALLPLTRAAGVPLLINDRIDVALACGAAGVQLAGTSLPTPQARTLVGPRRYLGVSTHSLEEAECAAREGADFVLFGPVFATPSKLAFGSPQGIERLRQVCRAVSCPVLAIGGIKAQHLPEVLGVGAHGVAVISAILASPDPTAAAACFVEQLRA